MRDMFEVQRLAEDIAFDETGRDFDDLFPGEQEYFNDCARMGDYKE